MTEPKTYSPEHTYGFSMMGVPGVNEAAPAPQSNSLVSAQAQESKGVAEIQAAYVIAKKFPRNEHQAYIAIMDSCKRPHLAEQAMYAYPRGSTTVTGPSIRLAEVLAQKYGNCKIGIEILSQNTEQTEARAYAIDLESNYSVDSCFTVKHVRNTKKGSYKITDERDIREMILNMGSRYLRGCIMRIIPGDIVESAIAQCEKTLLSSDVPISEQIKRMVIAFDELGVKVEHLEKRLGHNLDATIPVEIVALKAIYKALKDGAASREDFFDIASPKAESAKDELKDLIKKNKNEGKEKQEMRNSLEDVASTQDAG
jgi:hypothetical protein